MTYVSRPQYWGIQVVGTIEDIGPPAAADAESVPYSAELDLAGITGTEGVEVIGASQTERVVVSTTAPPQEG